MLDELLDWIERTDGPLPYLALAAGGASEYVIPVLPGDTVTLFGASLCAAGGKHPLLVYGAINAGSIGGALLAYAFGRWFANRPHALTKHPRTRKAIRVIQRRFARHGPTYLVINRFLPALRAFFFVAAGMNRMPVWQVLVYGGLSALLWNALILGVASLVGSNFEALRRIFERYTLVSVVVVVVVALGLLARWAWRRPRPAPDSTG